MWRSAARRPNGLRYGTEHKRSVEVGPRFPSHVSDSVSEGACGRGRAGPSRRMACAVRSLPSACPRRSRPKHQVVCSQTLSQARRRIRRTHESAAHHSWAHSWAIPVDIDAAVEAKRRRLISQRPLTAILVVDASREHRLRPRLGHLFSPCHLVQHRARLYEHELRRHKLMPFQALVCAPRSLAHSDRCHKCLCVVSTQNATVMSCHRSVSDAARTGVRRRDYLGCRQARPAIWSLPAGAAESNVLV